MFDCLRFAYLLAQHANNMSKGIVICYWPEISLLSLKDRFCRPPEIRE